jgi:hypothetical protein
MNGKIYKQAALLSILILVGLLMETVITASGPEKTGLVTRGEHIAIVKTTLRGLTPEEQMNRQMAYQARTNKLLAIAKKDERVQKTIAGKEYTVVGVALKKPVRNVTGTNVTGDATDTAFLALRVGGGYYKVTIDMRSERVTSIDAQSCYT